MRGTQQPAASFRATGLHSVGFVGMPKLFSFWQKWGENFVIQNLFWAQRLRGNGQRDLRGMEAPVRSEWLCLSVFTCPYAWLDITEAYRTRSGEAQGDVSRPSGMWEYTLYPHSPRCVLTPQSIPLLPCVSISCCEGATWRKGAGPQIVTTAGRYGLSRKLGRWCLLQCPGWARSACQ